MATTQQLVLRFGTMNGEKTWTYNNVKSEPTTQEVNTLMDAMITNGTIYTNVPLSKVSAQLVTKSSLDYELS